MDWDFSTSRHLPNSSVFVPDSVTNNRKTRVASPEFSICYDSEAGGKMGVSLKKSSVVVFVLFWYVVDERGVLRERG